jgi:hypothetical protein
MSYRGTVAVLALRLYDTVLLSVPGLGPVRVHVLRTALHGPGYARYAVCGLF